MADFTDLDAAFTLPETITDDDLRQLFEVLVARCRGESAHLPMSTWQQLRMERGLTQYVKIKQAERRHYGDQGGFQHPGQEKDANLAWQGLAKDFDDILHKYKPSDREAVLREAKDMIVEVLRTLDNTQIRDDLMHRFVATFERAGI